MTPSKNELARVAVVGSSCSGKTTLARELSHLLTAPHVELDALHWKQDWEPRAPAEFRQRVAEAVSGERWIVDGNYAAVRDLVWSRATAVLWLNYPFLRVFPWAISRTVRRALSREELYSGNRESLRMAFFSRDSILLWVITSFRRRQREYAELRRSGRFPNLRFWELCTPSETSHFLCQVTDAGRGAISTPTC